ncbi:MAG TPA: flagellar basal body rod protein [Bacillota bacterium]|nr:flagellar basal body rod protein [Bacillota bacterium]
MRTFILFMVGAIAALFLAINIGPLIWAAFCIWLLYLVYKQFIHSDTTTERIIWAIVGVFIVTIMLPVSILVLGIVALLALYVLLSDSKKRKEKDSQLMSFEDEWNEFNY